MTPTGLAPALGITLATALAGCASFAPRPLEEVPFKERSKTQTVEGVTVTAAVPTLAEAKAIYGVDLASKGIQPVWLEVRNDEELPYWFLPHGLDTEYFSTAEAAYAFHRDRTGTAAAMSEHFAALEFSNPVLPGETVSGFVLVNLDEGYKPVDIDLICRGDARHFTYAFVDPDFEFQRVDVNSLWSADELVELSDEGELRRVLEQLPTCTTDKAGKGQGDPLNLVLIGRRQDIFAAMVRRGWQATELVSWGSTKRTIAAFLTGKRYRYSPISPLYVYGRRQDFAAQKARGSINERNHMRFWLTPVRYRGEDVWVGQISRDIGVKFTTKSPTISTHIIDPDVDEARRYLMEDLAYSQALGAFGLVRGIGEIAVDAPRTNLVGDPYFTDGLRALMFFGPRPNALDNIEVLDWERAGAREELFE